MDFSTMNNLNMYARMTQMETQWNQRKSGLQVAEAGSRNIKQSVFYDDIRPGERESNILYGIKMKLAAGQKLTPSERQLLREKDPETYKKLVEMEREQKQYEERLKRCRTREEAMALRVGRLGATMDKLDNANGDMKIIMECKMQVEFDTQTYNEFTKSKEYKEMPENEAERAAVAAEEAEEETGREEETARAEDRREGEDAEEAQKSKEDDEDKEPRKANRAKKTGGKQAGKVTGKKTAKKRKQANAVKRAQVVLGFGTTKTAVEAYTVTLRAGQTEKSETRYEGEA